MLEFIKKKNTTKNKILLSVFIFLLIIFTITPTWDKEYQTYIYL